MRGRRVPTALIWFRRDLRLDDHPALQSALRAGYRIVPVYVHAPEEEAPWSPGAASLAWLRRSLAALDTALRGCGSRLIVRAGPSLAMLEQLVDETNAEAVYWSRRYEPACIARDATVKHALRARRILVETHNSLYQLGAVNEDYARWMWEQEKTRAAA